MDAQTIENAVLRISELSIGIEAQGTEIPLVDGVTLEVAPGEVLALVGESGSGKTLTSKSVLKIFPEHAFVEGSVVLNGHDVLGLEGAPLREVRGRDAAMIFQEPSTALNPVFTVGWQVEQGLRAHGLSKGESRKRAVELLRAVGIPEPEQRMKQYPHEFSGGQKQRIIIAMALALRPSVLIADEPTTALDVTVQAEILELLRESKDALGAAILLVTHNMGVVADLADRVAVMKDGKLVEIGPVEQIFYRPQDPYTQHLLASVPRLSTPESPLAVSDRAVGPSAEPDTRAVPALKLEHVDIEYSGGFGRKGFHAIHDVSFEVPNGGVLGLVGESGSGKSTIGKAIAGLLPVKGGRILLSGAEFPKRNNRLRKEMSKNLGVVFQDPASSFNNHLTVGECIAEPMVIHGEYAKPRERAERVAELLEAVQLSASYAHRYPYQLSGGQRQRVGIARALALNPRIIIADEPTSALDVSVQAHVLELFVELQKQLGFTTLFISHDLAVVEALSDRIAVLQHGRLVELGESADILRRPQQEYTRRLIDAVPLPDPRAQREKRLRLAEDRANERTQQQGKETR